MVGGYFLQSSLGKTAKWVGHPEHWLLFIGQLLCLLVLAAGPKDCEGQVQQSLKALANWQAALKLSPKATTDTCNLSPL